MPPDSPAAAEAAESFESDLVTYIPGEASLSSSSQSKYDRLHWWLSEALDIEPERIATVYLSDLSKQFTARVGASLISEPLVLVVLGLGDFSQANRQNISPVDRLARVCAYVGRIQLILVAEADPWRVPYVVGPLTSELFSMAQELLPGAEAIPVVVPSL
jgi:hypothetical protein